MISWRINWRCSFRDHGAFHFFVDIPFWAFAALTAARRKLAIHSSFLPPCSSSTANFGSCELLRMMFLRQNSQYVRKSWPLEDLCFRFRAGSITRENSIFMHHTLRMVVLCHTFEVRSAKSAHYLPITKLSIRTCYMGFGHHTFGVLSPRNSVESFARLQCDPCSTWKLRLRGFRRFSTFVSRILSGVRILVAEK